MYFYFLVFLYFIVDDCLIFVFNELGKIENDKIFYMNI